MPTEVGSSGRWVKICVEPTQSGLRAACLLAYRAILIRSGSPGFQRSAGSRAGVQTDTPMSTLAVSSAITTLPAVSTAGKRRTGAGPGLGVGGDQLGAAVPG